MKYLLLGALFISANTFSQQANKLYIDVHHMKPGSVTLKDVAAAHAKDLAVQAKFGVNFIKYWVDEKNGDIYCLASAPDTNAIMHTHEQAHGLLPHEIYQVEAGTAAAPKTGSYFLDIHRLGPGNVTMAAVEQAHQKDLAVQGKHGVNFINYWVDEQKGMVFCLSQASDATKVIKTHREAHGLMPASVEVVKEGN